MTLWIRADASTSRGLGHVMRTLAVAEAARAMHARVIYVVAGDAVGATLPTRRGFPVEVVDDPHDPTWLGQTATWDSVLFDGYHFSAPDFAAARDRGLRVGAIDDFGTGPFAVDVLVNPCPPEKPDYDAEGHTTVLLGPRYALVRQEFVQRRRARCGSAACLLVTCGGSDPAGLTERVIDALGTRPPFARVVAVLGPAAPRIPLEDAAAPGWLTIVRDPDDVASVFDQADAALTAAGSTTWELMAMGVPLALLQAADNQAGVVAYARRSGSALVVRPEEVSQEGLAGIVSALTSVERQHSLTSAGLATVDGKGAARVAEALFAGT